MTLVEKELCAFLLGRRPPGIPKEADVQDITVMEPTIPLAADIKKSKDEDNVDENFSSFKIR